MTSCSGITVLISIDERLSCDLVAEMTSCSGITVLISIDEGLCPVTLLLRSVTGGWRLMTEGNVCCGHLVESGVVCATVPFQLMMMMMMYCNFFVFFCYLCL